MYKKLFLGSAIVASTLASQAQTVEELSAKVDALTEEIAEMQNGSEHALTGLQGSATNGSSMDRLSFGGYGEFLYNHNVDSSATDTLDSTRAILYVGYQFSDEIKFVSEIEWEHGGYSDNTNLPGGEVIIEQAFLDFKLHENVSLKAGHVLVPLGYTNLYHEPTAFNGVNRPEVERYIIPSTWHENGLIVHGNIDNVSYQVGAVAGLNANNGSEVRGMKQSGKESSAENFAFVARLDYKSNVGFDVGTAVFSGGADQGTAALDGVDTTIAEVHAGYKINGFKLRGVYAQSKVSNANKVAVATSADASGESSGYYLTTAYDINDKWTPFVRYENYNRFDEKYTATTGAKATAGKEVTNQIIGVNYYPVKNVVVKADYNFRDDQGVDDDRFELALGYVF